MKQCAVLIVNPCETRSTQWLVLKRSGFVVREVRSWPDDDALLGAEVVVVYVAIERASMIAARLRARPRFGRRVLIAVVESPVSKEERRAAIASGFDDIVVDGREDGIGIRILRLLRARPEYPCDLPPRERKKPAA